MTGELGGHAYLDSVVWAHTLLPKASGLDTWPLGRSCKALGVGAPAGLTLLAGPLLHRQQSEQPHKQVLWQH